MKTLKNKRIRFRRERGFTIVELLVGMSLTLTVFMVALPVIDGFSNREQTIEKAALSVGDARVFSERVGRDLRLAYHVTVAKPQRLIADTYVRHSPCGGDTPLASDDPPTPCQVTYGCGILLLDAPSGTCTRTELNPDTCPSSMSGCTAGATCAASACVHVTLITGLFSNQVFSYPCPPNPTVDATVDGACPDPLAVNIASTVNYVGLNVVLPNRGGTGDAITLRDGTALRNIPPPSPS
jgi:type II secretory pathway pseudopilin PulG